MAWLTLRTHGYGHCLLGTPNGPMDNSSVKGGGTGLDHTACQRKNTLSINGYPTSSTVMCRCLFGHK
jgi:hypothetical protein